MLLRHGETAVNDVLLPGDASPGATALRGSAWLAGGAAPDETQLKAWLRDLCRDLSALHRDGGVHGMISPDHVVIDAQATLRIDPRRHDGAPGEADAPRTHAQGCAAFEQYVDDPAWPVGPWTDIYGMCALAHTLILQAAPPDALQRMVRDDCKPLRSMDLQDYSPGMIDALDRGMSILPQMRFASLAAFAEAIGVEASGVETSRGETFGSRTDASRQAVADVAASAAPAVAATTTKPDVAVVPPAQAPVAPTPSEPAIEIPDAGLPEAEAASARKRPASTVPLWLMATVVLALLAVGGWVLWGVQEAPKVASTPDAAPSAPQKLAPPVAEAPGGPGSTSLAPTLPGAAADESFGSASAPASSSPAALAPGSPDETPLPEAAGDLASGQAQAVPPSIVPQETAGAGDESESAPEPAPQPEAEAEPAPARASQPAPAPNISVHLAIHPWGEVFVDGVSRGVSPPVKALSLQPGLYSIEVTNGDLPPHRQRLRVQKGEPAVISHRFP